VAGQRARKEQRGRGREREREGQRDRETEGDEPKDFLGGAVLVVAQGLGRHGGGAGGGEAPAEQGAQSATDEHGDGRGRRRGRVAEREKGKKEDEEPKHKPKLINTTQQHQQHNQTAPTATLDAHGTEQRQNGTRWTRRGARAASRRVKSESPEQSRKRAFETDTTSLSLSWPLSLVISRLAGGRGRTVWMRCSPRIR